ncbi:MULTISPECIES: hypothetical protein [Bacillaceae]|uniref:Transcriptional regulator n=1 Tax=Caldibacillus thermoamylovorans TaxID=35841 RepID=A0ABD4A783_9BACI|nr:hypothetical protein [Caldibacillus thermoamylovorans]KIO69555.1 hypothetical protein B4166_1852 [Caldibacillus thermoamylovorans]KIO72595.1 hypothetical protein B4167_2897 [Caldibacillus thermoamylovorans]MDL0419684.1 hypothetical protein [Caldibacillus thermoamylovorans]
MKIRIGIIGPEDSVKRILSVANEFDNVEFIPYIYQNVYQVDELILKNIQPIDQWFFSGVLNFNYALKKKLVKEDQAIYPLLYGSSLFATLLEAQLASNTVFKKISIDTFSNEEIEKTFSFYNLKAIKFTNFPFSDYTYMHQLADFHESLYKQGKSEIALTSTHYAYVQLKQKNIPVYRMNPSYLSIKLGLNVLFERAQANRFKKSQIAIIGCAVNFHHKEHENIYFTYKMKQEELDIKKELLTLAEKVSGSFVSVGNGFYLIYTNRGEIDIEIEKYIIQLSQKICELHKLNLNFSIGYGLSASQAEQHVHLGLTQKRDNFSITIVDESQKITIRQEKDISHPIQYSIISTGKEWEEKIKNSGISVTIVSKIIFLMKHNHRTEFSSLDISRWLKCSNRNARRILLQLERSGVIKQCGEIQTGGRGRPMKLYCFIDNEEN